MQTFYLKRGDTGPAIASTLYNADGSVVNLTNATGVRFLCSNGVDGVGAIVGSPAAGRVSYSWVTGDTDTPGEFDAEWEVTFSDVGVVSYPRPGYDRVLIEDDLG